MCYCSDACSQTPDKSSTTFEEAPEIFRTRDKEVYFVQSLVHLIVFLLEIPILFVKTFGEGPLALVRKVLLLSASYANIIADNAMGKQLSAVTSAPTSWSWSYETKSDPIRANVAYDLWLGASPVGAPASRNSSYEIMVWLSRQGGIQPIGGPTASGIQLAGNTWTLWSGPNSNWQVLSFVSDTGDIPNFNADFKEFFDYLVQNSGVSSQQYVQAIQAGTEPFTGSANLVTHSYSVALN
ncbi:CAZyme family GH12 [Agaricus bisporus var. burnettii]|uniref:CAZyme family GH12 n=1 Tax=Agaricus bisporus var. burnettii TaxID=192524 RepID=A0A8H7EYH0_AGABI|nr:CAZyme family GH12 [Agaricus bisporus var. burnettii]